MEYGFYLLFFLSNDFTLKYFVYTKYIVLSYSIEVVSNISFVHVNPNI